MKRVCTVLLCLILTITAVYGLFIYPKTKAGGLRYLRENEAALQEHAVACKGDPNTVWPFRRYHAGYDQRCDISWFRISYTGFGSEYRETGFYYSETDTPSGMGNDLSQSISGDGIIFYGEGDNYSYVEKIKDNWYWYERHW